MDPRAGAITVRKAYAIYLESRRHTVAVKTWMTDAEMGRLMSPTLGNLHVGRVSDREVQRVLDNWSRTYAESSVRRFRANLSGFFSWAVRERMRIDNPVARTRVARQRQPTQGMLPFIESELEEVRQTVAAYDDHAADVVWLLAWTGLRWSEVRELRVGDLIEVPIPRLVVRRSAPETVDAKPTKSGRTRHVPLPDHLLPVVQAMADGKEAGELLVMSSSGTRLHAARFKRSIDWSTTGRGRRVHDLRHTAACLWLAAGVPASTVQAWLVHSSLQTTQIYVHYRGDSADRAALDVLNRRGSAGGARPD
ncbi:tyrosine-type recombinase/integrase [Aeromicrobium wangtongii]|uniref:tyrosine-type recombinase/integrase n=1 Tax=Aeromicrobium wangtongii TaxID=2969247 RepID=UPI002017D04C|nr:tyrosine-type recombinase/integrase [Aeromicrobium wangtongii]MCL3817670.1 tyrosine-type recombinase/integrase [Aeromicrobium wangtongii]